MDVINEMWKEDIVELSGIGLMIVLIAAAYLVGHLLRGGFNPTKRLFNMFFMCSITALILDAGLGFVVIAATIGYQPWLIWMLMPGAIIGVACLTMCAILGGMMHETHTTNHDPS